jgi:hypothetical protein
MSSQTSKVVFVGAGTWSSKVSRIIQQQDSNIEVQVIGARNFLALSDDSPEYFSAPHDNEFVWITTNPSLQCEVLRKLGKVKTKVILEKPIARTQFELQEIKEAICTSASEIYLSQPWVYSDIWSKTLNLFFEKESVNKIVFEMGDNRIRSDITPGLDWLPHELYFTTSIAEQFKAKDFEIDVEILSYSPERISANIKIGSKLDLEIRSGLFSTKIAQASGFANQTLVVTSNFVTGEIKTLEGVNVESEVFPTDLSILNMISQFRTNSPNLNWNLIFKLYSCFLR